MADQIILTKLDDEADSIIDAFSDLTGLVDSDDQDDKVVFEVNDADEHRIDVVQTLTGIDPGWTDHVGFELPSG